MEWEAPAELPIRIAGWLSELGAPQRLEAHLRLVTQAAESLLEQITRRWPRLPVDREAVVFGAATHDLGKGLYPNELSGPGSDHEEAGRAWLESRGVSAERARFAVTHAAWKRGSPGQLEDLLVALADNCWKGARPPELELQVATALAERLGGDAWETFSQLEGIVAGVAAHADARIEWQGIHPV